MTMHHPTVGIGNKTPLVTGWEDLHALTPNLDLRSLVTASVPHLVDLSRQAMERAAHSYRGFKVGTAILTLDSVNSRIGRFIGGNYTPYQGAPWGCAEKRTFKVIEKEGYDTVLGMAVTGPLQTDPESGIESPTLHLCHRCRHMVKESPLTLPDTLIVTAAPDGSAHEAFTRDSMLALHETGEPQPFPDYHPALPLYVEQLSRTEQQAAADQRDAIILGHMASMLRSQLN